MKYKVVSMLNLAFFLAIYFAYYCGHKPTELVYNSFVIVLFILYTLTMFVDSPTLEGVVIENNINPPKALVFYVRASLFLVVMFLGYIEWYFSCFVFFMGLIFHFRRCEASKKIFIKSKMF